ncbi:MAG: DinB family protein [Ginsengibacter sp.]
MKTQNTVSPNTEILIKNLTGLLHKGNAHVSLDDALENINFKLLGKMPGGLPYSIWQLAEHLRIAQWDILEFSRNKNYISPDWPEGYWTKNVSPASEKEWQNCLEQIKSDSTAFINLLTEAGEGIYQPFEYGTGQSLLKEVLVIADHNSYNTGEIIILRRLLNDWEK